MVTRLVLLHCCDTFHCPILFRNLKARNCPMQREIRSQSETALTNNTLAEVQPCSAQTAVCHETYRQCLKYFDH